MSVILENATVTYGIKKKVTALDQVTLSVDPGSIFGLLGPSGCGKTTLISCCLGITKPQPGRVSTCGQIPLYPGHGVPGSMVGYMPQDPTLHWFFTTREILVYYGRIFRIDDLEERVTKTLKLLDLADPKVMKRQVAKLSGGQRRRVSLACAMIHEPPLLVLDEPTVGIDPVLRQIIWRHLRELSTRGTTVIISTHYMEECSKADKVCFLRKGKVVGLGKPEILKEQYLVASLDDVFFKMCESDEDQGKVECNNKPEKALISIESADEEEYNPFLGATNFQDLDGLKMKTKEVRLWETFKALLFKNFMVLRRHGGFLVFNIFMPLVCFLMFLTCIGSTIRGLKLGIVNEEMGIGGCLEPEEISCPDLTDLGELYFNGLDLGPNLSCHVISNLDPFVMGKQTERTLEDARTAVVMSQDNGYLHFEQGFSEALSARLYAIITSSNITGQLLDLSEIKMSLDATNIEVARAMQISALKSVHGFFIDYSKTCNLTLVEEYISHLGISVHPIRPDVEPTTNLAKGMLPAVMVMILNMLAMALTADQLATEREEGLFQRDFVCGVSVSLILLSQMCAQLTVVVGEIVCSLILLAVVFPTLAWHFFFFLFFLFLIQAIVGMTLGFFITTLCKTRDQVMFLGSFCVFPTFILSGIIWPRIAMPEVLQVLSVFLPITLTGDVAKYVVVNQTYDAPNFWWGIIIPIIWSIGQFIVCLIIQASTVISNPDVIKYKLKRKK